MRWQWTIDDGVRSPHEVVVEAEPETSIEVLAAAVGLAPYSISTHPGKDTSAAAGAPVSGTVLPLRRLPVQSGGLALRFRAGPLAGHVVPLALTSARIGRADDNDIVVVDPCVSRVHLLLTVDITDIVTGHGNHILTDGMQAQGRSYENVTIREPRGGGYETHTVRVELDPETDRVPTGGHYH